MADNELVVNGDASTAENMVVSLLWTRQLSGQKRLITRCRPVRIKRGVSDRSKVVNGEASLARVHDGTRVTGVPSMNTGVAGDRGRRFRVVCFLIKVACAVVAKNFMKDKRKRAL